MKKSTSAIFTFVILMIWSLSGCSPASAPVPPTLMLTTTDTPLPTKTPIPTNTLVPTNTPIPPTATVSAPEKSLEYLNGVKVVYIDAFDKQLSKVEWRFGAGLQVKNGVLDIFGKEWNNISPRRQFSEGSGVVVDFAYTKGSFFETYISHGFWGIEGYKTFGIYFDKNLARTNVWSGKNALGGEYLPGDLDLQSDTDYSLLMAVIPNGEFLVVIWKPSDPSKTNYYREEIGKNWSNLTWVFGIAIDRGTITLDNFREIKFDSAK